jgi:hypothetical protein
VSHEPNPHSRNSAGGGFRRIVGILAGLGVALAAIGFADVAPPSPASAAETWETEPNADTANANQLTLGQTLKGASSTYDYYTYGDRDYFYFDITSTGQLTVDFTFPQTAGTGQAYELKVVDSGQSTVFTLNPQFSDWNGTRIRDFAMFLGAGRYYLQLYGSDEEATWGKTYQINLSATPAAAEVEFDSDAASANPLTIGNTIRGAASTHDYYSYGDNDFYYFDITSTSQLTVDFTFPQTSGTGRAYELKVIDADQATVFTLDPQFSDWGGDRIRNTAMFLGVGRYYLHLYGSDDDATWGKAYQIRLAATPAAAEVEFNSDAARSNALAVGDTIQGVGFTHDYYSYGDNDFYYFDLDTAGPVTAVFSHPILAGDKFAELSIVNTQGKEVAKVDSKPSDATTGLRAIGLAPGRYYVQVYTRDGWVGWGKAYTLRIIRTLTLDGAKVSADPVEFTGVPVCPAAKVELDGSLLTPGVDFTAVCSNNAAVGQGTITVTGIGPFQGTVTGTFEITAMKRTSIKGATVVPRARVAYTGRAVCPAVSAAVSGKSLTPGTDYTVACRNNVNPGIATVTVTGVGRYEGTASATFQIVPKAPKLTKAKAGKKRVTVAWGKVPKATSYTVSWRVKGAAKWKSKTVKASKRTLKVTKLLSRKTYEVRVRATAQVDGAKIVGVWSAVKRAKVK